MNVATPAVGIYDSRVLAEDAIRGLREARLDMKHLSIIGKDFQSEQDPIGFYSVGDRLKSWGPSGAYWGGPWGWLVGAGFFLLPKVGQTIVLGPLLGRIVGALEGATIGAGLGLIGAGLVGIGVPRDGVAQYESAVRDGAFVVSFQGPGEELEYARSFLATAASGAASYPQR
jgi:hypothetical protein